MTLAVILEMVSWLTEAPYTSPKWALISPVVGPLADSDRTSSSPPSSRRWRLCTITGSNVLSRSRGTSIVTGPICVRTVLGRVPLREFSPFRPATSRLL